MTRGEKWRKTMIAKYGSIEKFKEHMAGMGRKGVTTTGGFASNRVGKDGLTGPQRALALGIASKKKR